ncbi:MAG TPA: hypothetical protein VH540_16520 [Ktedonobacterales bacterium]|jgi:hypothetical protein
MPAFLHQSPDLKAVVRRLFTDSQFKEDAQTSPELAFAQYSLDADERKALKSLMGRFHQGDALTGDIVDSWWFF